MSTVTGKTAPQLEYYGYRFTVDTPVKNADAAVRSIRELLQGEWRTRLPCVDLRSYSYLESSGGLSFMFLIPVFTGESDRLIKMVGNMIEEAIKPKLQTSKHAALSPAARPASRQLGNTGNQPKSDVQRLAGRLQTLKRAQRR